MSPKSGNTTLLRRWWQACRDTDCTSVNECQLVARRKGGALLECNSPGNLRRQVKTKAMEGIAWVTNINIKEM